MATRNSATPASAAQDLIHEAQGIAQGLKEAAEAAEGPALRNRLEQAWCVITHLIAVVPEDGIPKSFQDALLEQRMRIIDAACMARCIRKVLEADLENEAANDAESATRLLTDLLQDISDKIDPVSLAKAAQGET